MAEAALSFLLENVRKLMVEQIKLIWGAEKELKLLQNDLELMKAFLVMEVANKRDKGELFIQFAKQMREEVFDAENTLDAFLMRKARGSGSSGFNNTNLANKVKELREKLKPMFEKAMAALLMAHESATSTGAGISDDSLKKMQSLREHNVVGLEDEEATIISNLLQQTEELDVISIVGMPGLGKTTLAWKIYSNPEIRNKFSELIWVHVSQKFNARDVFLTILKNFTDQNMSVKDNQELTQAVRYHLNEAKKFLLFIDDVWTVGDWKQIEAVLPKSANNVRKVVITSRQTRVAKQANRSREPHVLRFFTLEESWKLLQLEVFGNNCTPIELEELGQKIAMQCRGLPLTVVVIGVVLVQKGNRRDLWDDISESVSTYVLDDEQKRTANIIELSYNKMPPDLRDCFLYLGMFPKGGEISAWKLTRLWIAEGFIQKKRGKSLEEVSEDKLKDLVAMSLVMVEKTKANGGEEDDGVFDPSISEMVECRRLSIHSDVMEFLQRKPKGPGVRSLVCFAKETIILPTKIIPLIPEAFDLLRVIDVSPIKFSEFPLNFTKLMHLRYIALSGEEFMKSLPKDISKLWNLQTIKIDTMSRELEIKVDILKMMQLRHLKTKAAILLKELGGKGGENLQTLSRLSAKCCKEELFSRASNLKNLGIRGNLTAFVGVDYLGKLERLEKLKLEHDVFPATVGNTLHCLPDQKSFPPNLKILTLSSTYLDWQHMTTLGSLHNLEVLKLKDMAFKGVLWEAKGGGFRHLETLHIITTDLETWTASSDSFPSLKKLILKNCRKLQEIPSKLRRGLQLVETESFLPKLVLFAEKREMQIGQEIIRAKTDGSSGDDASTSSSSTTKYN